MARERLSRALSALSQGFAGMAEIRMQREAAELELLRQQSLEDLRHKRETDLETRRQQFETTMARDERTFRTGLAEREERMAGERLTREERLASERYTREDRRLVENEAQDRIAALTKRIQEVTDDRRAAEAEFQDQAVLDGMDAEINEALDQMRSIKARMLLALKDLGDPRYKDEGMNNLLLAAGYSREEIQDELRRRSSETSFADADEETFEDPTAIATQPQGPPQMPPSNELMPPSPPAVLPDMTKAGRGRRATKYGALTEGVRDLFQRRVDDPLARGRIRPEDENRQRRQDYRTGGGF
jgi:hypothetical protein